MSDKIDKHMIEELKETIQKKDPKEPVEKTLAVFCSRTGISMDKCRVYYNKLVKRAKSRKNNF